MTDTGRFDDALDREWKRYAPQLAGRIASLPEGGTFELVVETGAGPTTCVRVQARAGRYVRVEVAGTDAVTRPATDSDRLAEHVVSLLRGHCNVPHPAFLHIDRPTNVDGLRDRVSETLAHVLGRPAPVDADGDFVVVHDSHVVFVVVDGTVGNIRLWAPLLHGIPGEVESGTSGDSRVRAFEAAGELNRGWPHIKVVLVEDRLVANVDLFADPFVPRHLTELLDRLRIFLGTVDERFAERFDGMRYGSDTDFDPDAFDPEAEGTVFDEPT